MVEQPIDCTLTSVVIVASPYSEDDDLPWEYPTDAFVRWVWEVFMEGYKHNDPLPEAEQAITLLQSTGFTIRRCYEVEQ